MPQLDVLFNSTTLTWYLLNIVLICTVFTFYLYLPFFFTLRVKLYYNKLILNKVNKVVYSNFMAVASLSNNISFNFTRKALFFASTVKVNIEKVFTFISTVSKDLLLLLNKYSYIQLLF